MKKIIHKAETFERRGIFVYPKGLQDFLKSEPHDIVEGDFTNITIIHIDNVSMKYFYSRGLGSMPNEQEQISLYGKEADIGSLEARLSKKFKLEVHPDITWERI